MTQFKRFMVFRMEQYYPSGGINDCIAHSDDLDVAKAFAHSIGVGTHDVEIFDRVQGVEIYMFEEPTLPELPYERDDFKTPSLELPSTLARAAMTTKDLYLEVKLEKI